MTSKQAKGISESRYALLNHLDGASAHRDVVPGLGSVVCVRARLVVRASRDE